MNRNNTLIKRKERRRDRRRAMLLEAFLDGQQVTLTDLSAAGFGAAIDATNPDFRAFRVGKRTRLELRLGDEEPVMLAVEIIRPVGDNGVVGGVFVELSNDDYDFIESLLTGRFRRRR